MSYSNNAAKIRNKIIRYNTASVVRLLLTLLHTKHTGFEKHNSKPWVSCLMLEWTLELGIIVNAKDAHEKDIHNILNNIWALQNQAINIADSKNPNFSLRKFLIPQLRFQISQASHSSFLTRFSLLIRRRQYKNFFNKKFEEETQVSLDDFLIVSLFLEYMFKDQNLNLVKYNDLITFLHPAIDLDSIIRIINLLGSNFSGLRDICKERRTQLNGLRPSEYFLEPSLVSKPLILLNEGISTAHSYVATIGISEFALRFFKSLNADEFKQKFTKLFEVYIGELLKSNSINFMHENEIKSLYKSNLPKDHLNNKVADFLINDSENTLYIDAKGVEPNNTVLTADNSKSMKNNLRDHLIKGIGQVAATASNMSIIDPDKFSEIKNRYALIVTHQDFFLGDAKILRGYLGDEYKHKIDEAISSQIDVEKIHFCSISDFEEILIVCNQSNSTIFEFLDYCIKSEQKPETRKFHMTQHIESFSSHKGLDNFHRFSAQIKSEFEENNDYMMTVIEKSKKFWKQGISTAPYFYECLRRIQPVNT